MNTKTQIHTQEPWNYDDGFIVGRFSDGEVRNICDPRCAPPGADNSPEMDANTDRIIACVNALAGIPTADLDRVLNQFPADRAARLQYLAAILANWEA